MTAPRIAIIGTGMIGAVHLRAARHAGASVTGVLASSPQRSAEVAAQWSVPCGYPDLDSLLADRPEVVHICTPNNTHTSYAEAVIGAGIHVVIEKPVATTVDDAARVAAAAQAAGIVATVPYVYRYHPLVREIRARRLAGDLGDIALIHGSYLQDWLFSPLATTWRVDPAAGGASRAFADIGTHWCDLAEFVTGEALTEVNATTTITYPTRPAGSMSSFGTPAETTDTVPVLTEDIAVATFRTARGITANTVISQVSAGRKNRLWLEVDGTKGSAVFDQENPETIWLGTERGALTLHRGEANPAPDQARLNRTPPGHAQGWTDAFDAFVVDTYAAVSGQRPEGLPTVADGLRSVRIVAAVLDSAASGNWSNI